MDKVREAFEARNGPCGKWDGRIYEDHDEQASYMFFAEGYMAALELVEIAIERLKDGP